LANTIYKHVIVPVHALITPFKLLYALSRLQHSSRTRSAVFSLQKALSVSLMHQPSL